MNVFDMLVYNSEAVVVAGCYALIFNLMYILS